MYKQNQTGEPTINPLFFMYPEDTNTFDIQMQFFFGDSILVSPVLEPNQTSVRAYVPDDLFYDFDTHLPLRGQGAMMTFDNISFTQIKSQIRGGSIIPMRVQSADTTTEVRKQNFLVIIAPGLDGTASGSLYLDDGDSLVQNAVSEIEFSYSKEGIFSMEGTFEYSSDVVIEEVTVLGVEDDNRAEGLVGVYDQAKKSVRHVVDLKLTGSAKVDMFQWHV